MRIQATLVNKIYNYLGEENVRWFKHVVGLKKELNCVLRLNHTKKFIPIHPIHQREGMRIRNYMRGLDECRTWTLDDFEHRWINLIYLCIYRHNNEHKD